MWAGPARVIITTPPQGLSGGTSFRRPENDAEDMAQDDGNSDGSSNGSSNGRTRRLDSVVIRFAGDSGDGMQLTGTEFTRTAALYGNDIATFPDFPAEIRAPAGSLAGVSGFQLQFSSNEIFTAGDAPEVLVAMNPAALRTNLDDLEPGGLLILNTGAFKAKNLKIAGYEKNPLEDGSLAKYRLIPIDFGKHVTTALAGTGMSSREIARTQNFFALGLLFWMYGRDPVPELESIKKKFAKKPGAGRRERQGVPGRLPLRRDPRAVRRALRGAARAARGRALPQHHRQRGHGARPRHRRQARRHAADVRELPDHARVRRAAQPRRLHALRRDHVPGRGRDRGGRRGHRRGVRRRRSESPARRAPASRSSKRASASPSRSSCRSSS